MTKTLGKDGKQRKQPKPRVAASSPVETMTAIALATTDDIGPNSTSEVARLRARNEELEAEVRRLTGGGDLLAALLRVWDWASDAVREQFTQKVGLVAAPLSPLATEASDLDTIPSFLRKKPSDAVTS